MSFRLFSAAIALLPSLAFAETGVVLSGEGGLVIEGDFRSFDGEFYRLDTANGPITIAGTGLDCSGAACPADLRLELALDPADGALARLMTYLVQSYGAHLGADVREFHGAEGLRRIEIDPPEGPVSLAVDFEASAGAWQVLRRSGGQPGRDEIDTVLAFDAVVPAVSFDNPVTGLTLLAVEAAVAGEFPDWQGLGGASGVPVDVQWPEPLAASGASSSFQPGESAVRHTTYSDAADAVARNPGGLGPVPLSEIANAVPLVVTGPCGRGTLGMGDGVRSGDYPLSHLVVVRRDRTRLMPIIRDFLDWSASPEAWPSVLDAGFLDLSVSVVNPVRDGRQEALGADASSDVAAIEAAADAALDGLTRLNLAMRFESGTNSPDAAALFQIERLVTAIQSGDLAGKRLVFVGFSDADGAQDTNAELSERRAGIIRDAVLAELSQDAGAVAFEAIGLGEARPVACNGVTWGKGLNRRVEVWTPRR
ncbi:MAG: phosphate ABC transporter substrate-binding/OmpA family protein [Pseudomonadota bacterium]